MRCYYQKQSFLFPITFPVDICFSSLSSYSAMCTSVRKWRILLSEGAVYTFVRMLCNYVLPYENILQIRNVQNIMSYISCKIPSMSKIQTISRYRKRPLRSLLINWRIFLFYDRNRSLAESLCTFLGKKMQ